MGSGISSNYENITPMFTLGYWKVHSASRKDTHDLVSLWLLDLEKIKSDSNVKKDRNAYIDSCLYSVKTLQQLYHPNVLKVYEANENVSDLAFSAEPVSFPMERNIKYSNDEAYYIADQLASLASYLANDKKLVSFHYYPGSFVFNSKFILKLCLFNYTSLIIGNENKTVPRYPWHNIPYAPPLNYTAPEYSNNLLTTSAADTFSYGALITSLFIGKQFFNFQNEKDIQRAIASGSFDIPESIPSDIRGLLQCCFESDPSRRLTFNEIVRFPVFMGLLIRCLREIDSIMKRTQSDRYEFYLRLKQNITLFSPRLLTTKILPLLIDDVKLDIRFGPAVFPIIYFISEKLSNDDFMRLVFIPLGDLMRRMEPPEYGVAVLDGLKIVINHVERNLIYEIVYPILISGFSSPNSSVQVAAAKNMPFLASMVTENSITYTIIPKIGEIILFASDPKVIGYLLKTYEISLDKMDNDMFVEGVIPTLFKLWKKIRSPQLARPYLTIIQKQNASLIKNISFIVPLICEILKNEEVDLQIQSEFCNYVVNQFEEIRKERGLPKDQPNTSNDQKLTSQQMQQNVGSKLPTFAKQIMTGSMPNIPIHNEPQTNLSFFEQGLSNSFSNTQPLPSYPTQSPSPSNGNEFTQLDQDDIYASFNTNLSNQNSDGNISSNTKSQNISNSQNSINSSQSFNNSNESNNSDAIININNNNNVNYNSNGSNVSNDTNINQNNSNGFSGNNFDNFNSSSNNSNTNFYSDSFNNYNNNIQIVQQSSSSANNGNVDQEAIQQSVNEFSFF